MTIVIWILTFFLVLDCLLLGLLVLMQLPKKEAGLGQAFGGATTDALFGAGSGNFLTKATKYAAGIFFALTLLVYMLQAHQARGKAGDPREQLSREERAGLTTKPATPPANPSAVIVDTNLIGQATTNRGTQAVTLLSTTNAPATNAPAAKAP
jgi:preprotein translocase subunit SecG